VRVKKFQAKSMAEAMKMVKSELGPNAIILHTRDLGKGLLGFFMGKGVEVTAAVDPKEDIRTKKAPQSQSRTSEFRHPPRTVGGTIDYKVSDPIDTNEPENPLLALSKKLEKEKREEMAKSLQHIPGMPELVKNSEKTDEQAPKEETPKPDKNHPSPSRPPTALESRLEKMESQLNRMFTVLEDMAPKLASASIPSLPTKTRELYNHLLDQDVDEKLALDIAVHIADVSDEKDDIWTALKSYLLSKIPTASPAEIDPKTKSPKVLMLVGPTGVGKTTTLAKISAKYRYYAQAELKPKISFVTADLYRLAAVEQLQKYSEILGVELEVTYSPDEVKQALGKHKNDHVILFDTAGTCQRNMPQMSTLKSIVDASQPTEVHLVISSTTKFSDMIDIIEHFKEIKPTRLIFTKIDESTTYGAIFNTVVKYKIPISYLTTGQNVPEDIEIAKPERIAKLLLQKPAVNRSITITEEPSQANPAAPEKEKKKGKGNNGTGEKKQEKTEPTQSDKNDEK
jgi:flagellar biosynthesis protein FlhF